VRRAALLLAVVVAVACSGGGGGDKAKVVDGPDDVAVPNNPAQTAASLARVERALRA
jgi:hypothetical protein